MKHFHMVAFLMSYTLPLGLLNTMYTNSHCKQLLEEANFQECCNIPRLLPEDVINRCLNRSLPSGLPGEPDPLPANCHAECVLNETGILVNHQFLVDQAIKVLFEQVPNGTVIWKQVFEVATRKCYALQVANTFYLQDVAKNLISSQCIPSSMRFLECTFAIIYRDCPDLYWNFSNDRCSSVVSTLNNCRYLFLHVWRI
uniref:OBP47-like domain-containing protein n=1 Tax=Anopheles minimus TaxID=112268 RepID=A0A3F2Z0Y4_9DIPT